MKQGGTTLAELLVALAVAAILLTIGVPAVAALMQTSRLTAATNDLLVSLHLARSEAIKRRSRAVLCPSADGSRCAEGGGWQQGWLVFQDANNNAARDAGETLIQARQSLHEGLRVSSVGSTARYISYAPAGDTQHPSGAFQAGTLTLCNEAGSLQSARRIIISRTGRPRTEKLAACP